ncbi:sigma-70 family RNA polymerase sigma factor [Lysinibacillus sphaericus]|uniref:DNA-directed RNA polymerase sigma-24 subunit n=1 Tax=Lysinibacillus sphaericus OT4b.31 TaxID=1285586 RepID=R7ZES0_LYSSH|nr:sigma-70 family RNA polymerase sigma factor [Lysinibacillus sphaericus]EON72630.1 DNA-directed RNA polymerase sigma-24 subunit [Lysinibacillus sphaericus OT4b.31]
MEQLVEEYGEYLFHLSYLYVKDKQLAEEITQDVFFTYATKKDTFRGEAALKTFLTRILINRCHDELRKMKRKNVLQFLTPFWTNEKSAEQEVMKQQQFQTLKHEVMRLPIHYREVIILFYYEDFEAWEIADLLGISQNTVRTRLRRGKDLLKSKLSTQAEVFIHE